MQEIPRSQNRIRRRPVTQAPKEPAFIPGPAPKELTRGQYRELLKTAREMRRETAYLAMRMLVSTGVRLQELLAMTVEEVRTGELRTADRTVHLPDSLREELLGCAERNGVSGGAIFAGRTGAPLTAAAVRKQLRAVSRAAGFEDGEVTVRTLQKLYETTRAELMAKTVQRLMQEQQDEEQAEHGWES